MNAAYGRWTARPNALGSRQSRTTRAASFNAFGLSGGAGGDDFSLPDRGQWIRLVPADAACLSDLTTDGTSNGIPDGEVTLSDFSFYLALWGEGTLSADLTTDGTSNGIPDGAVTLSDFSFYLNQWGAGCP